MNNVCHGWLECELLNVSFEIHWILSKCKRKRRIFMVTGGVLTSNKGRIGLDGVSIPKYFYEIIYDPNGQGKIIAFLILNGKSTKPLQIYLVSVDSLESLTSIDFFPELPIQWRISWRV